MSPKKSALAFYIVLFALLFTTVGASLSAQQGDPIPPSDPATLAALASLTTTNSQVPMTAPEPPQEVFNQVAINTSVSTSLINLDDFRNDARFSGIDGTGYAVVILDTGINLDHAFFGPDVDMNGVADRIVYQQDFADGDNDATDVNGHGSNVSSIVASSDATFTGMAPAVDIIHLKVFTDAGGGLFSYTEAALQWVVANAVAYNIVSVNMSLGDSENHTTAQTLYGLGDEMAALASLGVTVVSSSGNSFFEFSSVQGVGYPSADPNSFSIGAVYDSNVGGFSYGSGAVANTSAADRITPFSQRHAALSTIFAPGAPITGAGVTNGGTSTLHGTSQAAPHIAGIVALMQQLANQELGRSLTVAEIESVMVSSATAINDGDDENDNVSNTNLNFPRVDVFAIGEAILTMADNTPPQVSNVNSNADTGDGVLSEGEQTAVFLTQLLVTFDEPMRDPANDDDADDVSNPANYLLLTDGGNGTFDTAVCGAVQGDDTAVTTDSVIYDTGTLAATVTLNSGNPLPDDSYRFFACGSTTLKDVAGNALDGDGDGSGGDDFIRHFIIEATPPQVFNMGSNANNAIIEDGVVGSPITSLLITFDEEVQDPVGDSDPMDVTNPNNYLLFADGDDGNLDTTLCGVAQGDDIVINIESVTYDNSSHTVTVAVNNGDPLPSDGYRVFVCGSSTIKDLDDNFLNGGTSDFSRSFTVSYFLYLPMIQKE